jgi:hypothetical protein
MTRESVLGMPMRVLLGLLGAIAIGAGAVSGLTELRAVRGGAAAMPTLLVAGVCALAVVGGVVLIRGAFRGRITVRRPGHRAPIL